MPTRLALTTTNAPICDARSRLASVRLRAPALTPSRPGGSMTIFMPLHPLAFRRPCCGIKQKADRVFGPCWLCSQPGDADAGGGGHDDRGLGFRPGAYSRPMGYRTGWLLIDRQVRDRA